MIRFTEYLSEEKNLHMEHLESLVINGGVKGTRSAINYLQHLRDRLVGNSKSKINITTKFDGAPAIIAGEALDGGFFVAKKGVFNKTPKLYKTEADIDADTKGDLNAKLKVALKELSKLNIKGIIQGDFLYTKDDLKVETIDGIKYITFHPNTIVYAVPYDSPLGETIRKSKIGIVWHTKYSGSSYEGLSATFGENIATTLRQRNSVWSVDAEFKDVSGNASFTESESKEVTQLLSRVGKLFREVPASFFSKISGNDEHVTLINQYINARIKEGNRIGNIPKFVTDMRKWLNLKFDTEADKRKGVDAKAKVNARRDSILDVVDDANFVKVIEIYDIITDAKYLILQKLNAIGSMKTFLKTQAGFQVTNQEGFVAIDHLGKNVVKLVDRLEFSKANFSPEFLKGWEK